MNAIPAIPAARTHARSFESMHTLPRSAGTDSSALRRFSQKESARPVVGPGAQIPFRGGISPSRATAGVVGHEWYWGQPIRSARRQEDGVAYSWRPAASRASGWLM